MAQRTKPLFWKINAAWPIQKSKPDHWVAWAMVRDQYKLVANRDLTHTELYEIGADVAESNNVATAKPEITAAMLGALKEWQTTLPATPTGAVFSKLREERSDPSGAKKAVNRKKNEKQAVRDGTSGETSP
jgi:N-acetylgalactosamine-6-sulfatase